MTAPGDTVPVLFDTDIGSDIDDAVALAYLLAHPRCELLGITTVTGDTAKRAALAEILCRAAGRDDVPIHAGAPDVLLQGPGQPEVPQYDAVAQRAHRADRPAHAAFDFLRRTIRARPGVITLLAVGPMTNLGALFAADPEIPGLLRRIVLMCGAFLHPDTDEWNARVDPIATALVFRHPNILSVGLDVTRCCKLPADECRRRFGEAGGPLGIVGEMAEVWFRNVDHITFHDPLAAALLFAPDLCGYQTGQVRMNGDRTVWSEGAVDASPHTIAADVDPDRFFAHYFEIVGNRNVLCERSE